MKLEVGEYIRTDRGTIDKLNDKNIMMYQVAIMGFGEKPIKASNNIIDLIEVGDYVNGHIVYSGGKKHFDYILIWDTEKDYYIKAPLKVVDIKSIVTKEQFESMSYKIEV